MNAKVLWGERHSGILVNFDQNSKAFEKTFDALLAKIRGESIVDFELSGRIKDAGMLAGKTSRCKTTKDFLTLKYEELGFRVVLADEVDLNILKARLLPECDFFKDYIDEPRKDGIILGIDKFLEYRALHIYTSQFGKAIEIQLMTKKMFEMNNVLTKRFGGYWKTQEFKEQRILLGDDR